MTARTSDHGIIAFFQREDKIMTAGFPCNLFHLAVCCEGIPQSDIFPYAPIKQIVILGDEGELFGVVLLRNLPNIFSSEENTAFLYIPKRGNQPCNRAFSATARANQGNEASFRNLHGNAVQYFFFFVGKMDITKRQVIFLRGISFFRALHFRGVQKSSYLAHNGSHGLEIIAVAHQSDKRSNKPYGKNDNHHKVITAK